MMPTSTSTTASSRSCARRPTSSRSSSEHTRLKKAGRSWKGLCPFHNERTPSFTVDRDKGLYHCFGCGAGGDVIHFVRQIDRLDFPEAVEALAARFGVAIPRRATAGSAGRAAREAPRRGRRGAAVLRGGAREARKPRGGLPRGAGRSARRCREGAGRRLRARPAGSRWRRRSRRLVARGPARRGRAAPAALRGKRIVRPVPRTGLVFTIRDERGRPVGFSGRALSPEDEPKYLNSPESPIFLEEAASLRV